MDLVGRGSGAGRAWWPSNLLISATSAVGRGFAASAASCWCCWRRRRWRRRRVGVRRRSGRVKELPIDYAEQEETDDAHRDHRLEVLEPELVLEGGRALLKLCAAVLQCIGALLKGGELRISLQSGKYGLAVAACARTSLVDNFRHSDMSMTCRNVSANRSDTLKYIGSSVGL